MSLKEFEVVDPDNLDHAGFVFDLMHACQDQLLDDYYDDIIVVIDDVMKRLHSGDCFAAICKIDGVRAGMLYVWVDKYQIAYLIGGSLPEYRQGLARFPYWFTRRFIDLCFEKLPIRKMEAEIPVYNHAPERLLKKLGFVKEGLRKEATLRNGKPEHAVTLGLTRSRYRGLLDGKKR